jgi:peptidoglycan hydrolase-like protein with peptidoglycan-binding domain
LTVIVVVVTVAAGGGFVAATMVKSPQQQVAEAAPPEPSVVTAAVGKRVLKQSVILRGRVAGDRTADVMPAAGTDRRPVVTAVRVQAGAAVEAGSVLLEVGGRPVIALPGAKPAYRDLRPGATGADVGQLQQALKALGHDPKDTPNVFGEGTKAALTKLYDKVGYPVAATGPNDDKELAAARRQVAQADRAVADAKWQLSKAPANSEAAATAQRAVDHATEDAKAAQTALQELQSTTGAMLAVSEVVFLPSFPARVEKLAARVGEEVKGSLITLSSGALVVKATVGAAQRQLLKSGMTATILAEQQNLSAAGTVGAIGEAVRDEATGVSSFPVTIDPSAPLDAAFGGQDVQLTVELASTDAEMLVVPLSAVHAGANGQTMVLERFADGREEPVRVTAGMSGDGYVAVTAESGDLQPGDQVVVGR